MKDFNILGILEENLGGSKYHRVKIPLDYLNNLEITINGENKKIKVNYYYSSELIEDNFIQNDLIYIHWAVVNSIYWISEMCEKHNVKIILDIDDFWVLPKKHIRKKTANYANTPLISTIADYIIVSNPRIKQHLNMLNDNILLSCNYLPIGENQFTIRSKELKTEEKIAIGVCGSVSHYHDYKSILWNLQKIANDKDLQKKCKFVLCGVVPSNKWWKEIIKFFTYKNFELEIHEAKSAEEYMDLYKNIDILLAPLSPSEYSNCKSALKIIEASLFEIPVIASEQYEFKEFNQCLIVRKSSDYYKLIKKLIENNQYFYLGKELSKSNISLNNFQKRISDIKEVITKLYLPEEPVENLKIYSIVYKDNQYSEFEKYDNSKIKTVEQKSYLFEYNPIIDIVTTKIDDLKDEDYLGILSYKFSEKMNMPKKLLFKIFKELNPDNTADVINLTKFDWGKNYLKWSETQHKGLLNILEKTCNKLNLLISEPTYCVHSNYFIANKKTYLDYVNNYLIPAINYFEENEEIKELLFQDANYLSGLKKEDLLKHTGLNHYTFHTFVLERLFSIYLENKKENLIIKSIVK